MHSAEMQGSLRRVYPELTAIAEWFSNRLLYARQCSLVMTVWVMIAIFPARNSHNLLADTGNLIKLLLLHRLNSASLKFAGWLLIKAFCLLLFASIY